MNTTLHRLSLRLLVPALALSALFALGEPLPTQAAAPADEAELASAEQAHDSVVIAIRAEAAAARQVAHAAASRMRWAMTLPAAGGGKRCLVDSCGG
ncbi:hypothetical protein [Chiayiivirga flava]|uniref:Uncharacterized protein n=1 Tax=Chiayiivirga flava TaxID=659595 RepID=A0A7W8D795_9GAMM|nr:hypothetical protein [Chiayiivirga flava]MBB5209203.1 hypothetical protein [Chiayiivirga flava]